MKNHWDANVVVTLQVDGKLRGTEVCTEVKKNGDITKTMSLAHATNAVRYFQEKIDFYNSDYFNWGQRKIGK